jgi:hypothetical protein
MGVKGAWKAAGGDPNPESRWSFVEERSSQGRRVIRIMVHPFILIVLLSVYAYVLSVGLDKLHHFPFILI